MTTLAPAEVETNPLNFLAMAHNICSETRWVIIPHTFRLEKSIDTSHILAETGYWMENMDRQLPSVEPSNLCPVMDPLKLSMRAHDYCRLTRVYISII